MGQADIVDTVSRVLINSQAQVPVRLKISCPVIDDQAGGLQFFIKVPEIIDFFFNLSGFFQVLVFFNKLFYRRDRTLNSSLVYDASRFPLQFQKNGSVLRCDPVRAQAYLLLESRLFQARPYQPVIRGIVIDGSD